MSPTESDSRTPVSSSDLLSASSDFFFSGAVPLPLQRWWQPGPIRHQVSRLHVVFISFFFVSSLSLLFQAQDRPASFGGWCVYSGFVQIRMYLGFFLSSFISFPLFFSFGLRGSSFSSVLTSVFLEPARPSSSQRGHASAKGGCLRSQLHVDSRGKSSCLDFVFCLFLSFVPVSFLLVVSSLIVTVSLPGCFDLLQLACQSPAAAGQSEGRRHRVPGQWFSSFLEMVFSFTLRFFFGLLGLV